MRHEPNERQRPSPTRRCRKPGMNAPLTHYFFTLFQFDIQSTNKNFYSFTNRKILYPNPACLLDILHLNDVRKIQGHARPQLSDKDEAIGALDGGVAGAFVGDHDYASHFASYWIGSPIAWIWFP